MLVNYKKGFKLSKTNFKKLHVASKQSAMNGNYGLACSLNILACEELIKSLVLHFKALHPTINFQGFDDLFKHHQHKHKELQKFLKSVDANTRMLEHNVLENKDEFLSSLPANKKEEYEKEYRDIERIKKRTDNIRKYSLSIKEIFDWLGEANWEKNSGLYVGYDKKNNVWLSPEAFTKKRYKKESKYTKLLKLHFENAIGITTFNKELETRGLVDF